MKKHFERPENLFMETPLGMVSRNGDWFHITADQIEKFVPGLLAKRSLQRLMEEAIAWVRSADTLAMTLLLVLLIFLHPLFAGVTALAFHFFWYRSKSAFVTVHAGKILKFMNSDGYMLITSLIILSYLAMTGRYMATMAGLIFFFLLKLGLLKRIWDNMDRKADAPLSLNDRVLKMILIKYGMFYNTEPREVKKMEEAFIELSTNRRKGGK